MIDYIQEAFIANVLIYSTFSLPFFFIFWIIFKKQLAFLKIQKPSKSSIYHIKHDLGFSILSFLIFSVTDGFILIFENDGYTMLYGDVYEYGWLWLFCSVPLVLFIDDSFFYWTHRFMHSPVWYKYFHSVHHKSTDPNPFTSYAFNPTEALIQNVVYCVVPFIIPLHFSVITFWLLFSMLNNVTAHLGYEVYPKWWTKIPILKIKTTATHHNMHHELFNGNYALYFTFWDKLMGTEFVGWEKKHIAIFEQNLSNYQNYSLADSNNTVSNDTIHKATATIGQKTYYFDLDSKKSILDCALAQNVPIQFSCKNGICGKCKMLCVSGHTFASSSKAISPEEQKNGYLLSCQTFTDIQDIKLKSIS